MEKRNRGRPPKTGSKTWLFRETQKKKQLELATQEHLTNSQDRTLTFNQSSKQSRVSQDLLVLSQQDENQPGTSRQLASRDLTLVSRNSSKKTQSGIRVFGTSDDMNITEPSESEYSSSDSDDDEDFVLLESSKQPANLRNVSANAKNANHLPSKRLQKQEKLIDSAVVRGMTNFTNMMNIKNKYKSQKLLNKEPNSLQVQSHTISYSHRLPVVEEAENLGISISPKELLYIKTQSCSLVNFAVNLMIALFSEEELLDPEYNICGRSMNNAIPKKQLDSIRINQIKNICLSYVNSTDHRVQDKEWAKMRYGMSKKLSQMRRNSL